MILLYNVKLIVTNQELGAIHCKNWKKAHLDDHWLGLLVINSDYYYHVPTNCELHMQL